LEKKIFILVIFAMALVAKFLELTSGFNFYLTYMILFALMLLVKVLIEKQRKNK
jgi:uncharacterized protein (DUF58 family)